MCPEGSSRPVMEEKNGLYHITWKRPDGAVVHAYWTSGKEHPLRLPFAIREAFDHLGRKLTNPNAISANDGIVYLIKK